MSPVGSDCVIVGDSIMLAELNKYNQRMRGQRWLMDCVDVCVVARATWESERSSGQVWT